MKGKRERIRMSSLIWPPQKVAGVAVVKILFKLSSL